MWVDDNGVVCGPPTAMDLLEWAHQELTDSEVFDSSLKDYRLEHLYNVAQLFEIKDRQEEEDERTS